MKNCLGVIVFVGLFILLTPSYVFASEEQPPPPPDYSMSEEPMETNEGIFLQGPIYLQTTNYIQNGTTTLTATGSRLAVSGYTRAYSTVDRIAIDLYIQRWNSNQGMWIDVVSAGEFPAYESSFASGGKSYNVLPGYYYRARGVHKVTEQGSTEQSQSVSNYFYIN